MMAQDVDDVDALSGAIAVVENWVRELRSHRRHGCQAYTVDRYVYKVKESNLLLTVLP